MTEIEAVRGDITTQHVDAIVNAANCSLLGGGGVDGAIHRVGGPTILDACRELRRTTLVGGLPTGAAVATTAGRLPSTHVIHTVGPVWSALEDRSHQLASAYSESMRVAEELGATSIAFPAVSAGVYGWPMRDAARIAVETVRAYLHERADPVDGASTLMLVRFVLFRQKALAAFRDALRSSDR
ncbi:MAG: O-acetyl-ADP-ribose deacetylase [Terrimesophilobacter sp.]